ncbi:hypothetical protein R3P38DRAFT_511933 [Favolaschia claudopus]|uniref:Uncharacterized protein n=1 Tax=Favolaschia claudopus TaxID=2862362 RepID=A0AAV9ZCD7_9AGAR
MEAHHIQNGSASTLLAGPVDRAMAAVRHVRDPRHPRRTERLFVSPKAPFSIRKPTHAQNAVIHVLPAAKHPLTASAARRPSISLRKCSALIRAPLLLRTASMRVLTCSESFWLHQLRIELIAYPRWIVLCFGGTIHASTASRLAQRALGHVSLELCVSLPRPEWRGLKCVGDRPRELTACPILESLYAWIPETILGAVLARPVQCRQVSKILIYDTGGGFTFSSPSLLQAEATGQDRWAIQSRCTVQRCTLKILSS